MARNGFKIFDADTHIIDWLAAKGISCDIITDEEKIRIGIHAKSRLTFHQRPSAIGPPCRAQRILSVILCGSNRTRRRPSIQSAAGWADSVLPK